MHGSSIIVALLTRLTQKNVIFNWLEECEESFQELKDLLTISPVLTLLKERIDLTMYSGVLGVRLGGIDVEKEGDCLCLEAI